LDRHGHALQALDEEEQMAAAATLTEIGDQVRDVAERFGSTVVGVGRGWRVGTGVVIAPGRVLTAARHAGDEAATVAFRDTTERGTVTGSDRDLGVAVLEVDTADVEPLDWVDGGFEATIGAPVIALGNPGGRGLRATLGFVSAAERTFRGPRGRRIAGAIEHTAALPRGSAGGPLLDLDGRLIGINLLRSEGGLILALGASGGLREAAERLARGEELKRPMLGIAVAPPIAARRLRRAVGLPEREGVLVRAVEENGPADRAGVTRGDLIVAAGSHEVDGIDSLHRAIDESDGGRLALKVVRGVEERELEVDLVEARR
jgi:serine protease Do